MKNLNGLYEGMSNEEYHAAPGLSNTGLTELARSPWHYYSRFLDPSRPERERKAGQFEGTIAHCAILEPNEFMRRYVVTPSNAPRRPTAAQWNAKNPSPESVQAMAWWSNWEAENEGREVVSHDDYSRVLRQAESVRRIREVRELFEHGKAELSAFATADGVLKKCRPDWTAHVGAGDVILIDLAGHYAKSYGRTFYSINTSKALLAGTILEQSFGDQMYGGSFPPCEVGLGNTSQVWLDRVEVRPVGGGFPSVAVDDTAVLRVRNCLLPANKVAVASGATYATY